MLYNYIAIQEVSSLNNIPAGPPSNIFCECRCPDVYGIGTSEQSTSMRLATNSCSCGMLSLYFTYNVPTALNIHSMPFALTLHPLST